MKKKEIGITLIALVITIIVLLILAGVTINAIVGNESAMKKAKEARAANESANELDTIKLAVTDAIVKETDGLVHLDKLNESLNGLIKSEATGEAPWIVTANSGKKYRITLQGQVISLSGVTIEPEQVKFVLGTTTKTAELTGTLSEDLSGKEIGWSSNNANVTLSNETGINTTITLSSSVTSVIDPITVTAKTTDNVGEAGTCKVMVVNNVQSATVNALKGETGTIVDVSKEITNKDQIEDIRYSSTSTYVTVEENTGKVTVKDDIGGETATITIVLTGVTTGRTKSVNMQLTTPTLPIGEYVEYDVSYVDMYSDTDSETSGLQPYTFTKADGWRILDVGEKNSNGDYINVKIVSTGIPAKIHWSTVGKDISKPNWWGDDSDVRELYNTEEKDYTEEGYVYYYDNENSKWIGNPSVYVASGLIRKFEIIPLIKKDVIDSTRDLNANTGGYKDIINSEAINTNTCAIFKNSKAHEVHGLKLEEANIAINKINKKTVGQSGYRDENSTTTTYNNLFHLGYNNQLQKYGYVNGRGDYYYATPGNSTIFLIGINRHGGMGNCISGVGGLRPVITLNSPIYKDGDIWKIR